MVSNRDVKVSRPNRTPEQNFALSLEGLIPVLLSDQNLDVGLDGNFFGLGLDLEAKTSILVNLEAIFRSQGGSIFRVWSCSRAFGLSLGLKDLFNVTSI